MPDMFGSDFGWAMWKFSARTRTLTKCFWDLSMKHASDVPWKPWIFLILEGGRPRQAVLTTFEQRVMLALYILERKVIV